jgi:hypothetical protein
MAPSGARCWSAFGLDSTGDDSLREDLAGLSLTPMKCLCFISPDQLDLTALLRSAESQSSASTLLCKEHNKGANESDLDRHANRDTKQVGNFLARCEGLKAVLTGAGQGEAERPAPQGAIRTSAIPSGCSRDSCLR